jgi:signal transduction histidine kinase
VARSSRFQITAGAAIMLVMFLVAIYFAGRETFREHAAQVQRLATVGAATSTWVDPQGLPNYAVIRKSLATLPVPPDGAFYVVDLIHHALIGAEGPDALLAHASFGDVPGDGIHEDADGVGRVYGSAVSESGEWKVVVGLPRRLVWESVMPVYRRNAFNAGWWYVLSVGLMFLFVSRWLGSQRALERIAARVTAGDLSTPPIVPMATTELDQMQRTMIEMITRVRELQRQVVRQERLAAIGVLVSGVAHEINNPLQAILGFSQVLSSRSDMPAEARADLAIIQRESERASMIIRNLSRFTRQQPDGPVPMRLNDVVHWIGEMWQRRFDDNGITFEVIDQSVKTVNAVATEIQQVALNFLTNAEYAVVNNPAPNAERRIVLRTRDTESGCVRLEIEDSGPGVTAANEANLFQPFFTTKPVGEGTGLGLSVSYGIVQSHGGTIGHDRGGLGGARFYLELPAQ